MGVDDSSTWRCAAGDLTWRAAVPADEAALDALLEQTAKRLGRQDRPSFFAPPVLLCMVAVDAEGVVRDAFYIEAVAEIVKLGLSRDVFEAAPAVEQEVRRFLRGRKIRLAHMWVPTKIAARMESVLRVMGFEPVRRMRAFASRV